VNREERAPAASDIEKRAKELLDTSIEHLDGRTLSRLTQARHAALDEAQRSRRSGVQRWWLPATGVATAAVVAVMLVHSGRPTQVAATGEGSLLDDFEIVAEADNLDMLQDVEFYSWLPEDTQDVAPGVSGS